MHGVINQPVEEHFTVSDKHGNLISGIDTTADLTVYVYNPNASEVESIVGNGFVELGDGNYKYLFDPDLVGTWYVVITHPVYFPWGKTGDVQVYDTDISGIYEDVRKTLGLVHHNIQIDEPVYDANGNMTSARVRIYADAASVGSGANILETYLITADGTECGQFNYWQQVTI